MLSWSRRAGTWPIALLVIAACDGPSGGGSGGVGGGGVGGDACGASAVPGPDGACEVVGIDGCAPEFVEADGVCVPTFAKCPGGTVPVPNVGCEAVGIEGCAAEFVDADGVCSPSRALCPPGTIPQPSVGCVPVGIEGCAAEFVEADGLCKPAASKCAAGTFPIPTEGCVPIDGAGCGAGTWGDIADVPGTVWVDPSYQVGDGDGSQAKPFPTIALALGAVASGGRVALAAGTYAEPLHVTKAIEVVGRCPSLVHVQGWGWFVGAEVIVGVGANGASVRRISIGGARPGVLVTAPNVALSEIVVDAASGAGLVAVGGPASVSVARSVIRGTVSSPSGAGIGVIAEQGASVSLVDSAVLANRTWGVLAQNGSDASLGGVAIDGTLGYGTGALAGGSVAIHGSAVLASRTYGVHVAGASATLTGSVVADTKAGVALAVGVGAGAVMGGALVISGSVIADSVAAGVDVRDAGSSLELEGSLVVRTVPSGDEFGGGVFVYGAEPALITGTAIAENVGSAIAVSGADAEIAGCVLEGTASLASTGDRGHGLYVENGAVSLSGSAVVGSHDAAVTGFGAQITLAGVLVSDTEVRPVDQGGGFGIYVGEGTALGVTSSVVRRSRSVGVVGWDATIDWDGGAVLATSPNGDVTPDDRGGSGVVAMGSAIVSLRGVGVRGNAFYGVGASTGGLVSLDACVVEGNASGGAGAYLAKVDAVGSAFVANSPAADGQRGEGLMIDAGELSLASSLLMGNATANLHLEGTFDAELSRVLSRDVAEAMNGQGDGLAATGAPGVLVVDLCRFQGAARAGILVGDASGSIGRSAASENAYGLVLQGTVRPEILGDNAFFGNGLANVVENGDLTVPSYGLALPEP